MPTTLKLFLSVVVILIACYLVTTGTGLMNHPSDMAVFAGVVLIFIALVVLYFGGKLIWFKKPTVTNKQQEVK